jgi:1-acyl-sn-glycerol-3-phosphate acyltransferase
MVIGSDRALGRGHWIPRPVRVEIRFGDAIDFLDEQDEEKALTRLRRAMQSLVPEEPGTSVNAEA